MANGSIELLDSLTILQEELPELVVARGSKKSIEEEQEAQEEDEEEQNYDHLFYGNCFYFHYFLTILVN